MAWRRWRRSARLVVGLGLIPPLFWLAVVVIAPTGWARRHVRKVLESRSGRPVSLERLSVCPLGGIHLTNLEIGSPRDRSDPWLKAADLRLDLNLFQILRGRLQPTRVEAEGVRLRVARRRDGTVELADLIRPVAAPSSGSAITALPAGAPAPVVIQVRGARITVVDEPTETRLQLE